MSAERARKEPAASFGGGWNYRVVEGPSAFTVHEVYYAEDGQISAWDAVPASPYGEDADDCQADATLILGAFQRPVLRAEDMPGAASDNPEPARLVEDDRA